MSFMSMVKEIIKYELGEHDSGSAQNGRTSSEIYSNIVQVVRSPALPGCLLGVELYIRVANWELVIAAPFLQVWSKV